MNICNEFQEILFDKDQTKQIDILIIKWKLKVSVLELTKGANLYK